MRDQQTTRLADLAAEAGFAPAELRAVIVAKIDRVVRERVGEPVAGERILLGAPASRRAPAVPRRNRYTGGAATCPNGHPYLDRDVDRLGRRRCSRCRPRRAA